MSKIYKPKPTDSQISIHRMRDVDNAEALVPGMEAVFFAASSTQSFENDAARIAFRERWLGRFLHHDPQWVYVALKDVPSGPDQRPNVVGYLIGALDDPAEAQRFADLGYFQTFKAYTKDFPAQLHVNLAEDVRGQGQGSRLVAAFISDAKKHGVAGVHVVTGEGARNVGFYNRLGFKEMARADWNDHTIVFLGCRM